MKKAKYPFSLMLIIVINGLLPVLACSDTKYPPNTKHSIPLSRIHSGGPPPDGIPSIDKPKFISVTKADKFLRDEDMGIAVTVGDTHRFYPNRILVWHEIVNDVIGKQPVLVTFCPLCGTGIVFEPIVKGKRTEFGTSGKLWNSNLLMYDRRTKSYWSQVLGKAVVGEMTGTKLKLLPYQNVSWRYWKKEHPKGEVLSRDTGHQRDYNKSPYGNYNSNKSIYFPVDKLDKRYHPKSITFGIEIKGKYKVYPMIELEKSKSPFVDQVAGVKIKVTFSKKNKTIHIKRLDTKKEVLPFYGFWFSWMAVHPKSSVYKAP